MLDIKKEFWKNIKNYEDIYEISNTGLVRRKDTRKCIKPYETKKGYLRLGLSIKGKRKQVLVHRIVAETFIQNNNPQDFNEVNHIDLNKKNNNIENLEWVNGKMNVLHAMENIEGRKEKISFDMKEIGLKYNHVGVEASKKPVLQIDIKTNKIIKEFESAREASRCTGANYRHISSVCRGKRKTHFGYFWKFA